MIYHKQDTIDILGKTYSVADMKTVDAVRLTALAKLVAQIGNPTDYESPSEYIEALSTISTIPQLWSWLQIIHNIKACNMIVGTDPDRAAAEQFRNGHSFQILQLIHRHEQEKNPQRNNMISLLERHFYIKSPEQKLYAIRRGLLGLTAGEVQQDDVVALLPGSAVPLLLRAVDLSKRTFLVVGPSFLPDSSVEWNNPEMADEAFDDVILVQSGDHPCIFTFQSQTTNDVILSNNRALIYFHLVIQGLRFCMDDHISRALRQLRKPPPYTAYLVNCPENTPVPSSERFIKGLYRRRGRRQGQKCKKSIRPAKENHSQLSSSYQRSEAPWGGN